MVAITSSQKEGQKLARSSLECAERSSNQRRQRQGMAWHGIREELEATLSMRSTDMHRHGNVHRIPVHPSWLSHVRSLLSPAQSRVHASVNIARVVYPMQWMGGKIQPVWMLNIPFHGNQARQRNSTSSIDCRSACKTFISSFNQRVQSEQF